MLKGVIKMTTMEPTEFARICNTLFYLGVPAHVCGYGYLITAIECAKTDPSYLKSVTGRLYPVIADEYLTTPKRVERSIRNAIEIAFSRCPIERLSEYFGAALDMDKGKVTNSEFIATVAQKLKLEEIEEETARLR